MPLMDQMPLRPPLKPKPDYADVIRAHGLGVAYTHTLLLVSPKEVILNPCQPNTLTPPRNPEGLPDFSHRL